MLYLEHLNLVVKDISPALAFYQAAFPHWRIRGEGQSTWYGKPCLLYTSDAADE